MSYLKLVLILIAAGSLLLYWWAIGGFFSRSHGVHWRMRVLQYAGTVSAIIDLTALVRLKSSRTWTFIPALALYILGVSLFIAAAKTSRPRAFTLAFSRDQPTRLVDSGIYSVMRHPFYAAYTCTWFACAVAAPGLATLVPAACMLIGYIVAAREEEAKFATSSLAGEYAAYTRRVGLLWPKLFFRRDGEHA